MKHLLNQFGPAEAMKEFDMWVTASLGEIKDTRRFEEELSRIVNTFEIIGIGTGEFKSPSYFDLGKVATAFVEETSKKSYSEIEGQLQALASTLFLVTGKTDNNAKCQFPLFLRRKGILTLHVARRGVLKSDSTPRVIKAGDFMKKVASLSAYKDLQKQMLEEFLKFILSDDDYISQFWSIGNSYFRLKEISREKDILSPLVVFQVRGSVSASGGHGPEATLRDRLQEWGLLEARDYNLADVIVVDDRGNKVMLQEAVTETSDEELSKSQITVVNADVTTALKIKTRAYDFVLPYRTPEWEPRIFIQSQFYAGDSGSVSHKNVDQTSQSRSKVLPFYPEALFIEYVDGAGYYASLNRDLRSLLELSTTADFFQLRSAPIRLRRQLQAIGFVTPLEIEHAILRCDRSRQAVVSLLISEGYMDSEITRAMSDAISRGLISEDANGALSLAEDRRQISRRYLLLDILAEKGATLVEGDSLRSVLLVPGNGSFYGMKLDDAVSEVLNVSPAIGIDWQDPRTLTGDIRWLAELGFVIAK